MTKNVNPFGRSGIFRIFLFLFIILLVILVLHKPGFRESAGWSMPVSSEGIFSSRGGATAKKSKPWKEIKKGLAHRILTYEEDGGRKVYLQILRVDLARLDVGVIDSMDFDRETLRIDEFVKKSGALAAINANFFWIDYKEDKSVTYPLGLVLSNNKVKNPLAKEEAWGVFYIKKGKPGIVHTLDYPGNKGVKEALQVGPRLVVEGSPLSFREDLAWRSAVGIGEDGRVYLIATETGGAKSSRITLASFARIISLPEKKGGLGLKYALNLDGGTSTQMYARPDLLDLDIRGFVEVPVALGIFEKKKR